jgi:TonB family protein
MLLFLANLLIRSALILGAGVLFSRLCPRLRPSQRHAIVLVSFLFLLVWPLLASLLPAVHLPFVQPSATDRATVTVQQFVVDRHTVPTSSSIQFSPVVLWGVIAFIALAPLVLAHVRLRVLLSRSIRCDDESWNALLRELSAQLGISKTPALLIHSSDLMPMASSVLHPAILLPSSCYSWTATRRRIVLLHELAHIARRDLLSQGLARLVAAAWWFQPLTWGALRELRRESERACDELVISNGIRPSDYGAELLAIAQTFAANQPGLAMARPDGLEVRLHSILQPVTSPSRALVALSLLSLTALTFAASAVTFSPKFESRGHTMKHTLFAGLLASAGLSAATIGGALYDPSGSAVANAKALLIDPDTNAKFETTTAADGKFSFEALPPGQYILRVQSPGFATLFRELNVKGDTKVERSFTLSLGKIQETVSVLGQGTPANALGTTVPAEAKPLHVGGQVAQANLVTKVNPVYPKAAKVAGVQGTVNLEAIISKEGVPIDIRVLDSPSDDLTQSSLEAVRQWRYKPVLLNGNPVEVITTIVVNYTLAP